MSRRRRTLTIDPSLFLRWREDGDTPRPTQPYSPAAYDEPTEDRLSLVELMLMQLRAELLLRLLREQAAENNNDHAAAAA